MLGTLGTPASLRWKRAADTAHWVIGVAAPALDTAWVIDPEGLSAFLGAMRAALPAQVRGIELDAHINDEAFAAAALQVFDDWVAQGLIRGAA